MTFEHKVSEKTKPEGNALGECRISRSSKADGMRKGKGIQSGIGNH